MRRINHWYAPRWVRLWMMYATRGGDGWLWSLLGATVLLLGDEQRFIAVSTATLAAVLGIGVFLTLKRTANRRRPCAYETHCWASLFPPDQFSFPSGHTITAFSIALSLGAFYPTLFPALLFVSVSIAASRVILGMHFLSDVVTGAVIGVALSRAALWLVRLG